MGLLDQERHLSTRPVVATGPAGDGLLPSIPRSAAHTPVTHLPLKFNVPRGEYHTTGRRSVYDLHTLGVSSDCGVDCPTADWPSLTDVCGRGPSHGLSATFAILETETGSTRNSSVHFLGCPVGPTERR